MSIGSGIVFFVIGVIFVFVVNVDVLWVNFDMVGYILMGVGVIIFLIGIVLLVCCCWMESVFWIYVDLVMGELIMCCLVSFSGDDML